MKAKYFVLKPAGCSIYAQASRAAMLEYAEVIFEKDPRLAYDIKNWVMEELSNENISSSK